MKVLTETHYKCGICGGCYHSDCDAAEECCSTEEDRFENGVSEDDFQKKQRDNTHK